jgi:hypothetical protein
LTVGADYLSVSGQAVLLGGAEGLGLAANASFTLDAKLMRERGPFLSDQKVRGARLSDYYISNIWGIGTPWFMSFYRDGSPWRKSFTVSGVTCRVPDRSKWLEPGDEVYVKLHLRLYNRTIGAAYGDATVVVKGLWATLHER